MKIFIIFSLLVGAVFAQNVTVTLGSVSVPYEAAYAYESWRIGQFASLASPITLTSALDSSTVTFALTGVLTQLAVGNQIVIDSEVMTISAISGQNVTVATRAAYAISTYTVSTPAAHGAGATVNLLKWASAVTGFKALIAGNVQNVVTQYCTANPTKCPTLNAYYTVIANAQASIAAIVAGVVQ